MEKPEPKKAEAKPEKAEAKAEPKAEPKKAEPKKKAPVKKAKPEVSREDLPDDDEYDDDSTFSRIIIFAGIVCIILLLVLVRVFTDEGSVPVNGTNEVTVYMDFTCEHAEDAWNRMIELKNKYGDDLVVKIRHFPLSNESIVVDNAIQCAKDQDMHYKLIDRIFDNEKLDAESLKKYAWAEGLNINEFYACIDDQEHYDRVRADFVEGYQKGVRNCPTFFVGDEMVEGVQSMDFFEARIG